MTDIPVPAQAIPDREAEFEDLEASVHRALDRAARSGVDGCEVSTSTQGGLDVTVRLGDVETIEHTRDRGISVTVYRGGRKGHASSAELNPAAIDACVDRAVEIAGFTEPDPCNGLADPSRLATEFPDLDLWHPRPLDAAAAIERALTMEQAGREPDGISNSEGASVSGSFGLSVYGNSNGFVGRAGGTRYAQSCVLIAGKGDGMQRDYWWDAQRRFDDLETAEATGAHAAERTLRRLDSRQLSTRRCPVVFAPETARTVLGHFVAAIAGSALYRNASFLKDTVGQRLFPEWMSIAERPRLRRAASSAAFDGEGVATAERDIVDEGVLTGYVLSSYSARRLGLETTGNAGGVHNLEPRGPAVPLEALLEDIGEGLLVTEVMGQGVSIVTGDYSRGAAGFWVEGGRLAYPVEEITVAGNLRDMFGSIRSLGADLDARSNIRTGSICIDGMTIGGS